MAKEGEMECPQGLGVTSCFGRTITSHLISRHFLRSPLHLLRNLFCFKTEKSGLSTWGRKSVSPANLLPTLEPPGLHLPHEAAPSNLDALCLPVPSAPHRSQGPSILHSSSEKQLTRKSTGICHNFHPKSFSNKEA